MSGNDDSIYIAGPDGKPMEFASEAEVEAYRRAQREAEPPLLQCLRRHRDEVLRLCRLTNDALVQPRGRGRGAALTETARRLHSLKGTGEVMSDLDDVFSYKATPDLPDAASRN